jgi:hypothetical protein
MRRGAALAACVLFLAMASGCPRPVDTSKLERDAVARQRRMNLPGDLTRPRHLQPFSGEFSGDSDEPDPGFSLSIPPGGWFRNTGLAVPGAAVIFVHGETDPFDVIVAVAPEQPALPWGPPSAPDAAPALAPALHALAISFFTQWYDKVLQPAPGSDFEELDTGAPHAWFKGYFPVQGASRSGAPLHDTARIYAFPASDGSTTLLIFTYPELFESRLEMYINDIASSFRTHAGSRAK